MTNFKLIDEQFEIEFDCLEIEDFEVMSKFVRWCDSYSRDSLLIFHFMKDYTNYLVQFKRDLQLPRYIKSIFVYVRKPSNRIKRENEKIKEFKDWIFKKFKKANPRITQIKSGETNREN